MAAFLFDLDGTLIDSRDDIAASANAARRALGLEPLPVEALVPFIGEGARRLVERAVGTEGASRVEEAFEAWRAHYAAHLTDTTRVYEGIPEALAALEGPKAVVTNKPGPFARRLVEALGLGPHFAAVVGGGDTKERKPDPGPVREALARLATREPALVIGDSAVDVWTARAAGLPFVGVTWGLGTRASMEEVGARVFVAHPVELASACSRALALD